MREIKLSRCIRSNLKRLTIDSAKIHLYACAKNEFALVQADNWKTLYAFESPSLTKYLEKDIGDIDCASLHESACRIGNIRRLVIELRLKLNNGSIITITDWDKVYKTYELPHQSQHAESMYSPYSAWGLPPEPPFVWMSLTGRLVDHIESISIEGQQKHLLTIMWKEYELASKAQNSTAHITVQSEFLEFRAIQLNQYLVKFDLT